MEIGTAIFLSSIIVAVVLLYGFTKDRWSWRRIIFRSLAGMLLLAVVGAAAIFAAQYWDQFFFPVTLDRQTEYGGLRLGMSRDEVRYIKGLPTDLVTNDMDQATQTFGVIKQSELPKEKTINDYQLWSYEAYKHSIHVDFGRGPTVLSIACYSDDKLYHCPAIGGVQDGTSETDLLRRLGTPTKSQIRGATKTINYDEIGVEFNLEKESVYRLAIGRRSTR
jgi:hypothetical protein